MRYRFSDITINYDSKRVPLSANQREERKGKYPYYGAQGIIDYIDDYIFDGKYLLIAEDGENLKSKKQKIAQLANGRYWVNNHAHIVQTNEKCLIEYLYYIFNITDISGYITGSAQPKLSQANLNAIELEIPPMQQQKKIVSILSAFDKKIELNQKINENLEQQMQTLYQNLLFESDCTLVRLEELALKIAMGPFGANIKVSTFVPSGVPIISGNHLRFFFLEEQSYNYITEEHAQKLKNSMVFPRDIIFTHAGNIGQVAMIPEGCDYPYYMISQRQFYMRCDESKVIPEIVLFFFHSIEGKGKLLANANSTGVPSIARPSTHLKNIEMPLPAKEVQDKWHDVVRPMVRCYTSLCQENKRLIKIRDSLLPRLMSGKIDISSISI